MCVFTLLLNVILNVLSAEDEDLADIFTKKKGKQKAKRGKKKQRAARVSESDESDVIETRGISPDLSIERV